MDLDVVLLIADCLNALRNLLEPQEKAQGLMIGSLGEGHAHNKAREASSCAGGSRMIYNWSCVTR